MMRAKTPKPRREFSLNCGIAVKAGTPVENALEADAMCKSIVKRQVPGKHGGLAGGSVAIAGRIAAPISERLPGGNRDASGGGSGS